MTSDASLPPNTAQTTFAVQGKPNGSIADPHQPQPRSTTQPDPTTAVRSVDGEADAFTTIKLPAQPAAAPNEEAIEGEEVLQVAPNPVPLSQVCADVHRRVEAFLAVEDVPETAKRTQQQVRESIAVIEKALEDYGFEHLSLSYNGGKDCLVLLLLYLAVLHTHFTRPSPRRKPDKSGGDGGGGTTTTTTTEFPTSIPSIYATPPDPFPAVTSFVALSSSAYHLSLTHIRTNPPTPPPTHTHVGSASHPPTTSTNLPVRTFRDAFALYLHYHPSIEAIFVGTRRTDPHGATLANFQRTDGNWPDFMRVHPVLDWRLSEIWCFLRWEDPRERLVSSGPAGSSESMMVGRTGYCAMYDEGYTSLGGRGDTVRNPLLKVQHGAEAIGNAGEYRPAWTMVEDREERAGRE